MKKYVIALDQSTSASKVFLLDDKGGICSRFSKKHRQFYPQDGFVEHDAAEIWRNVEEGILEVTEGISREEIASLAISNQRETVVFWDRETGEPLCPAVVWQDVRGEYVCQRLRENAKTIYDRTGLPLSPYYPAAKITSILESNPTVRYALQTGRACVGTIDSFLVFRLTGGNVYQTDVSNAGRTQLLNLETLEWDDAICALFGIDPAWLPRIALSDSDFGRMGTIPITGVMGDSHAALFGQGCLQPGSAKATYGTGSSVMMNVGTNPVQSSHGLSACVAFGFEKNVYYALEGNVTCSGDALCWLRDEAELIEDIAQAETLAASVPDTDGVYMVPAFSGLGAPFFDSSARGAFVGLNRSTRRTHLVRAALESMAYQDEAILNAMALDMRFAVKELRVDGGPTRNSLLMQFQSDLLNTPVICAATSELSALGAGYMAGITTGLYESLDRIPQRQTRGKVYLPQMDSAQRQRLLLGWKKAIQQCRT